jgi:hypothetical protein
MASMNFPWLIHEISKFYKEAIELEYLFFCLFIIFMNYH